MTSRNTVRGCTESITEIAFLVLAFPAVRSFGKEYGEKDKKDKTKQSFIRCYNGVLARAASVYRY